MSSRQKTLITIWKKNNFERCTKLKNYICKTPYESSKFYLGEWSIEPIEIRLKGRIKKTFFHKSQICTVNFKNTSIYSQRGKNSRGIILLNEDNCFLNNNLFYYCELISLCCKYNELNCDFDDCSVPFPNIVLNKISKIRKNLYVLERVFFKIVLKYTTLA